ncbi:hypothetical protein BaRGS_00002119 [Batillaria attramentaria]|uniref:Uncharacterized protein n=1 Tax=Batillaria attramentaria TaxID=370345 RepID=A0ABD0M3Y9_9CAEN
MRYVVHWKLPRQTQEQLGTPSKSHIGTNLFFPSGIDRSAQTGEVSCGGGMERDTSAQETGGKLYSGLTCRCLVDARFSIHPAVEHSKRHDRMCGWCHTLLTTFVSNGGRQCDATTFSNWSLTNLALDRVDYSTVAHRSVAIGYV